MALFKSKKHPLKPVMSFYITLTDLRFSELCVYESVRLTDCLTSFEFVDLDQDDMRAEAKKSVGWGAGDKPRPFYVSRWDTETRHSG